MARIELRDIGVSVPVWGQGREAHKVLLDGLTADLTERRIAIIGANGSGKSTLLRLLNGLTTVTSGQVLIDGIDPAKDAKAVRGRVSNTSAAFAASSSPLVPDAPASFVASLTRVCSSGYFSKCGGLK